MRLGVLDVGSNSVHLLVVDAHRGAHPWPAYSEKSILRLAEQIDDDGCLTEAGADALVAAAASARRAAKAHRVDDLLGFATSAVRGARNGREVLDRVRAETGIDLRVLPGADEARLTFLAVRRWFGWSAGRLLVLDIGGGSLELAAGIDELPDIAVSLPLGAGRLTRERLDGGHPTPESVDALTSYVESTLDTVAEDVVKAGWRLATASSKTFRTLARLAGAAPSGQGLWEPRHLTLGALHQVLGFIRRMDPTAIAELEGVSPQRAHQIVAGAIVAETAMRRLGIERLEISPWALREGVILRRLDVLDVT